MWEDLKQDGNEAYKTGGIEPIDLFKAGGILQDFAIGCIIKYAFRNRRSSGGVNVKDMKKIIHYAKMLMELGEGNE